jgi:uncharacterized protein
MGIAKNIVAYREDKGRFNDRNELKKVAKLGEKTFNQCAGFMRIAEGKNPLDGTSVHPESYAAAELMLKKLGIDKSEIAKGGAKQIEDKILQMFPVEKKQPKPVGNGLAALAALLPDEKETKGNLSKSIEKLAADIGIGVMTLTDIISEMKKPARDPREDAPAVVFRNDVLAFEDLKIDMELTGTVRNVVDFGAFVDIGVKNDGLVHVSQISDKFIKHPMDAVSVGDTVKVKILSIDHDKHKVSLTMKF